MIKEFSNKENVKSKEKSIKKIDYEIVDNYKIAELCLDEDSKNIKKKKKLLGKKILMINSIIKKILKLKSTLKQLLIILEKKLLKFH